jgi:uncharacterized protein YegJ (DUF2314 family)
MKYLFFLLMACLCCACNKTEDKAEDNDKPDTLIESGYDEQEMDGAIARARKEVDTFIAELSKPTGEDHAVKVAITENDDTEHFWLIDVSYRDGQFEGVINNEPGIVKNVRMGEKRKVNKADISDWMFMRGGKMYGNYTLRPLLKAMPENEAERYRSILANP